MRLPKNQGLLIRIILFVLYAGAASWLTFFYVYLKNDGALNGFEVGVIAALQQFNNLFVLPVWGVLADRYGRKKMMLIAIGCSTLLLPVFIFIKGAALFTLFMILVTLVYNPIATLCDTIALDYEEQSKGKTSYGELRMFASLGWAISSFVTGSFINESNMYLIFVAASVSFTITWLMIKILYKPLEVKSSLSSLKRGVLWDMLSQSPVLLAFLMLVFVYCIFMAPVLLMINVYYDSIGASNKIIGLAILVQAMSELPFFFFGKRIVQRFGAQKVFLVTMFVTAFRMLGYGAVTNPNHAVMIGAVNGVTFGLFMVSMIAFVHNIVPAKMRATGQSLIYTFYTLGVAIGNIFAGAFDDIFTMQHTMTFNGLAILLLAVIVIATSPYHRRVITMVQRTKSK